MFPIIFIFVCCFSAVRASSVEKAELLRQCYNNYYNGTPGVFEDFLRGYEPSLYLHKVYWTKKEAKLPLTIFTGLTLERLSALEAQCRSYPGPHAAAIYVPLIQQQDGAQLTPANQEALIQADGRLQELFDRLESEPASCAPTLLLLYEAVADPPLAGLLPVNALRNAAALPGRTPLAAMVDVDLAPSASLGREIAEPSSLEEISAGVARGWVWVLPAWETPKRLDLDEGTRVAEAALAGDKAQLAALEAAGRLHFFAQQAYRRGHAPTNFSRWLAAGAPYAVPYEPNYEPWFIADRLSAPPYDVRFRGYGWNKVAQVAAAALLRNATFGVHPRAWLVHRPHAASAGQALYSLRDRGREETRLWRGSRVSLSALFHRRVSTLRHVTIRDMRRGTYAPGPGRQAAHCREVLPWWR